jgi:hypothetical protein
METLNVKSTQVPVINGEKYIRFQKKKLNQSFHYHQMRQPRCLGVPDIQRSNLHGVLTKLAIIPCAKIISWLINHIYIENRLIINKEWKICFIL